MYSSKNKLYLSDITFERNYCYLFSKVTATLKAGEVLQVRGQNGSGKSTLLRMMAGLLKPHGGIVTWNSQCIFKEYETYVKHIVYIGHLYAIKPMLTVYENLSLATTLAGHAYSAKDLNYLLTRVNLDTELYTQANHLSAGQLRRLCLARLLASKASLWILDEPTTALDTEGQILLNTLLKEHLKKNGMACIATHYDLPWSNHIIYLEASASSHG